MQTPQFVYVIEIATSAEGLWDALTSKEFWVQFSGPIETDWKAGSAIRFLMPDRTMYSSGVVLESDPPHLLSHTWPDPDGEQTTERAQRLTWRIEKRGPKSVTLTLVQENLTEKAFEGVSEGWPTILDGLKDLLESGRSLAVSD